MVFQKQDMQSNHYKWSDNPGSLLFEGQPSRRIFDRFNGDQVLFIINYYGSLLEVFTLQDGRRIEYEISHQLPLEAKSELSVFNWIRGLYAAGKIAQPS
jgi:hypothetical protein